MAPEYAPLHAANKAGKFPAPEYAHGHKLTLLLSRSNSLWLPLRRALNPSPPGLVTTLSLLFGSGRENQTRRDLGPPEWPTVPQQHTPPFSWEDHWHEVHARDLELGNNQDVNIGGGLEIDSEHIICPLPVVTD
ncbi:hypothetical protein RHS01_09222 [Rhizoctonia solani]|uniref:Uncharacterized protein n=1 Tax=Rhizoctonia solani TaxID=456999 RepID=A0A8H7I4B5_9AGAM|nr:hypothetical protein RHS01_09222 [Rhizoctonia solani]